MRLPVPVAPVVHSTLTSTVNVLSTMITPAVLIMACGSLILTTSTRLIRAVDRVREMEPEIENVADDRKLGRLLYQLDAATRRARMLQRALAELYAALAFFVGTSVGLAFTALSNLAAWVPLTLGLAGAALLFAASIMLIFESRIALAATYAETDYIRSLSRERQTSVETMRARR